MATVHRMPRPADSPPPIGINRRIFSLGLSAEELGLACHLIAENSPHWSDSVIGNDLRMYFPEIKRKEFASIFEKLKKFGVVEESPNGDYYVSAKFDLDR